MNVAENVSDSATQDFWLRDKGRLPPIGDCSKKVKSRNLLSFPSYGTPVQKKQGTKRSLFKAAYTGIRSLLQENERRRARPLSRETEQTEKGPLQNSRKKNDSC